MSDTAHVLQYLVAAGFVAAAVAAYRDWLLWRGRGRAYLATAIMMLALVALLGVVAGTQRGLGQRIVTDFEVAAFLAVGYFLFLYRHDLDPVGRAVLVGVGGLCVAALASTVAVVTIPVRGGAAPLLNGVLVLVAWLGCVAEPTWRLWNLSGTRPAVQRARLRALSLAYVGIVVITVVETLAYSASSQPAVQLALGVFSLALAPVLFVAFAPPAWLRHVWRQREEEAYGAAMADLLVSSPGGEPLAARAVEWAVRLVGGAGGILVGTEGHLLASLEVDPGQAETLRSALLESGERVGHSPLDASHSAILLPSRTDRGTAGLAVVAGAFSPVFGDAELTRLQQYVAATAAALERDALVATLRRREEEVLGFNDDLERRVAQRTEELEATNRELEAFSYTVSHDLRAPLRAVNGFARILLEEHQGQLDDEGQRYLRLVCENAEDMGQLIDGLLSFSRLSRAPLRRQEVAPTEVARHALAVQRGGLTDRAIDARIAEMPPVRSDAVLLEEVYSNLIGNAIKFTRDRAEAVIEVGCVAGDGEPGPVFFVRDNGIGFDMRYAEKIFGVFQRLHRGHEYDGTGAGLAIVQRIITRHGGRVWADALPGQGATFYFTLGGDTSDE